MKITKYKDGKVFISEGMEMTLNNKKPISVKEVNINFDKVMKNPKLIEKPKKK